MFSCLGCGDLFHRLAEQGRTKILVVGIEAHVCVQQTVLDLMSEGFRVYLAVDAVGSRFEVDYDHAGADGVRGSHADHGGGRAVRMVRSRGHAAVQADQRFGPRIAARAKCGVGQQETDLPGGDHVWHCLQAVSTANK